MKKLDEIEAEAHRNATLEGRTNIAEEDVKLLVKAIGELGLFYMAHEAVRTGQDRFNIQENQWEAITAVAGGVSEDVEELLR